MSAESEFARVRVRAGWETHPREGYLLAGPIRDTKGQNWMCIQWDGEDDPDLFKCSGIEMAITRWEPVKP